MVMGACLRIYLRHHAHETEIAGDQRRRHHLAVPNDLEVAVHVSLRANEREGR